MSRSVLVTGGNRGLGLAIAQAFADQGDKVAITHRSGEPPAGLFGVKCDVTDSASVERAVEEVTAQQGAPQVLVANAGITNDGLFMGMSEEEFMSVIDTNFLGAVRATRAVVPAMVKARWGRLIFIGSAMGMWGSPGLTNYASSKSAMVGFARSLAWELGKRNITANVVTPGVIETELIAHVSDAAMKHGMGNTAMGRPGRLEELPPAVQFLASEGASYITGAMIPVSGGAAMGH